MPTDSENPEVPKKYTEEDILRGLHDLSAPESGTQKTDLEARRTASKEVVLRKGYSENEAERIVGKAFDSANGDEYKLKIIEQNFLQYPEKQTASQENKTERSTKKETEVPPNKETLSAETERGQFVLNGRPKTLKEFTDYLKGQFEENGEPAAQELIRHIDLRLNAFNEAFKYADLETEAEIQQKLTELNLASDLQSLKNDAERMKKFIDSASKLLPDQIVIESRFKNWQEFWEKTDALYHRVDDSLASLPAKTPVPSEESKAQKAVAKLHIRREQQEDAHRLGPPQSEDEDVIRRELSRRERDAKEKEVKSDIPKKEEGEEEKDSGTYEKAREVWSEARKASDAAEQEYRAELKKYYQSLEDQTRFSVGKLKYEYQKLFGIKPHLTSELQSLKDKTVSTRREYKRAGAALAVAKYSGDAEKDITVSKRYERLLAHKLIVQNLKDRNAIQFDVLNKKYPEGSPRKKFFEKVRKYRYVRMAGTVGAYALLGLVTGGVGSALVVGGARASGMAGGFAAGAAAGAGVRAALEKFYVGQRSKKHEDVTSKTKDSLFAQDIAALEKDFETSADKLTAAKRNTKFYSAGAAAAAGLVTGGGFASAYENSVSTSVDTLEPNQPPSAANVQGGGDAWPNQGENGPRVIDLTQDAPLHQPIPEGVEPPPETMRHIDLTTDTPEGEYVPEVADRYVVRPGDDLWKILEERYSERLSELPNEHAKDAYIDSILDKLSANEELRDAILLERDNIDLLKPGEQLDLRPLDAIAGEPQTALSSEVPAPAETIPMPDSMEQLTLGQLESLVHGLDEGNQATFDQLRALGSSPEMIRARWNDVLEHYQGEIDPRAAHMTIEEYVREVYGDEHEIEPEDASFVEGAEQETSDALLAPVAAAAVGISEAVRDKSVTSVEGKKGILDGIFGTSGGAGTFEKIQGMTMEEIRDVLKLDERAQDQWLVQNGISDEGWDAWISWISKNGEPVVPVSDTSLTLGQYHDQVVGAQNAARSKAT